MPHFTKHKDGRLMLLAGLWDCAVLEGQCGVDICAHAQNLIVL